MIGMQYWLIVISPENYKHNKEVLGFEVLGFITHYLKTVQSMQLGDRVVYYIKNNKKFGGTSTITSTYYEDYKKLWPDERRIWPLRCSVKPDHMLGFDELLDTKELINDLSFIENKKNWGAFFQGSIKKIPEKDFKFIENKIKKIISERANKAIDLHETCKGK